MGFGYLLLGYLISFLLSMTAGALGFGSLALILGYVLMLLGLLRLVKFHRAFSLAAWILLPLFLLSLYWLLSDVATLFLLSLPWLGGTVEGILESIELAVRVFFQLSLLYGIRMLADSIELKKISSAALRNTLFVGLYAMLTLAGELALPEAVLAWVVILANILHLVWIVCILWLLLSCMKNIGVAGEEENTAPTGPRWLRRINDAYERTHDKLNEQARADGEAMMRRRQEKKKNRSKKKK